MYQFCDYASINVKPEGGGDPGICGAFDFSEEFLVKIPTVGPQNLVKSNQIPQGVQGVCKRVVRSSVFVQI